MHFVLAFNIFILSLEMIRQAKAEDAQNFGPRLKRKMLFICLKFRLRCLVAAQFHEFTYALLNEFKIGTSIRGRDEKRNFET